MDTVYRTVRDWNEFDSLATDPLYYYVGAGLSIGAGHSTGGGLAGWHEMACLIWRYLDGYERKEGLERCPDNTSEQIEDFLDRFVKGENECAQRILSRESGEQEPPDQRAFGRAALLNMLLRILGPCCQWASDGGKAVANGGPGRLRGGCEVEAEDLALHSLLWQSGCHGILTSNYDLLLEHAFCITYQRTALRSYRYTAVLLRYILSNRRFVLHLHGDINDIATMEFHPSRAWREGSLSGEGGRGDDLKRVYRAALERGHMIYLGCGFRDETIRRLHDTGREKAVPERRRLALVRGSEVERGEIKLAEFPGIEFLTWDDPSEIQRFVEQVAAVRKDTGLGGFPSLEATDLHGQLFMGAGLGQHYCTEPWTCRHLPR